MGLQKKDKNKIRRFPTTVIVKLTWLTLDGQSGQDYHLVALFPEQSASQVYEKELARLHKHDYTDCFVEVFDYNHVPPGAIPDNMIPIIPLSLDDL